MGRRGDDQDAVAHGVGQLGDDSSAVEDVLAVGRHLAGLTVVQVRLGADEDQVGEPQVAHDAGDGAKVRVTFADGRVIEGIRDGADAKHGFFLVPLDAARTNTRRIYVAREATSDIKDG